MWSFVSGFFPLVWVFKVYSYYTMYQYLVSFYSWEIFHCISATFLFSYNIVDICFPLFLLLWIMPHWVIMCKFFCGHFYISPGCMKVKVLVTQLYPAFCDPMNYSSPGSSVHGILQARTLEWVAIPFSRGSSPPWDWTQVSYSLPRQPGVVLLEHMMVLKFNVWGNLRLCTKGILPFFHS